jgi:hypothetical protein
MLIAMEMKIAEKLSKTISLTDFQWHPKKYVASFLCENANLTENLPISTTISHPPTPRYG